MQQNDALLDTARAHRCWAVVAFDAATGVRVDFATEGLYFPEVNEQGAELIQQGMDMVHQGGTEGFPLYLSQYGIMVRFVAGGADEAMRRPHELLPFGVH